MEYVSTCKTALNSAGRCLLYGAGNIGQEAVEVFQKTTIKPVAFIDSRKTGFWAGLPVFHPESTPDELKKLPVVITIFSYPSDCSLLKIIPVLKSAGFHSIISFESFYLHFHNFFEKKHFWLSHPDAFEKHTEELDTVCNFLADDISKNVLQKQIAFRLTGEIEDMSAASPSDQQYFDSTVPCGKEFREFWDLGAFTGDTLKNAAGHAVHFRKVVAFEPDMANFTCCCKYLEEHRKDYESAIALPLAAGEFNEILKFTDTASSDAAISDTGNTLVPSVSLDSAFIGATPDFIKMDIEGSELAALKGMRNILIRNRPLLAVCIYHRPEDIYVIPLYLKNLPGLENYSFYIRCYGEHLFDTVLYAVPSKMRV